MTTLYAASSVTQAEVQEPFTVGTTHHIALYLNPVSHVTFSSVDECLALADAAQEAARRLRLHELAALRAVSVAS